MHYAVQLALYIDVLERLKLSAGRRAFVWDIHGDEVPYDFTAPQGPKKPETLWDEYETALAETRAILARQVAPLPAYSGVCKLCHWYTFCLEQLTNDRRPDAHPIFDPFASRYDATDYSDDCRPRRRKP